MILDFGPICLVRKKVGRKIGFRENTQDLFNLISIKQDLEEQFGVPVDIVSYRQKMNNYLKRRIEEEALYA